ncbi:acyltransferase [Bradyrhizobium sp. SSUT18]|uniref:acyltransferase family protein n=1 Tax=Bradyrhizobium sp. SSUT18 TaxID=3040602 RepID=UPI0024481C12|nr:acyltransferase [Bradyrhizobium sp. SSUT18]MDH2399635.1 acyltransferase [Bradyrhizobium sp. SSUT18]
MFLPFYEPTGHIWPLLIPGWTLNYEMFFYMVFGICMLTRQAALSVIALLLILVLAGLLMAPEDPMLRIWTGPLLLEFGIGVLISTLMIPNSTRVAISSLLMSLALAVLFIVCRKVFELDLEHPLPRVTLIGGASGALVVAGLTLEKLKELPDLNILRWLGDRSYSLYLVHLPIIDTARQLFGTGIFALTGMFLISIVLAHWVYVCGEQVATNWLKQRLGLSRVPKPAVARA